MKLHKLILTENACYKAGRKITVKGIMVHSTGANNPMLNRYVGPDDGLLGKNKYNNHWNQPMDRQICCHAFIGKLADGTVATVQTMPWEFAPWGCGSGSRGSLNNTHIQFEICDDGYKDKAYFEAVYREACEITAYLCALYNLDPLGTFLYNGIEVPVITTHAESYKLKLGSNHGDPLKWLKKFGKTMEDARNDVAALMRGEEWPEVSAGETTPKPTPAPQGNTISLRTLSKGCTGEDVRALQILLKGRGCNGSMNTPDGIFGPNTQGAVKLFQEKAGLEVTGIADQPTMSGLLGVKIT